MIRALYSAGSGMNAQQMSIDNIANNSNWLGGPRGIAGIPHPPNVRHVKALTYGVLDPRPWISSTGSPAPWLS